VALYVVSKIPIYHLINNAFYYKLRKYNFPAFQDLHIMVFLGFGLIMTFLKRYSRGMLVHAFLVGGLVIQWATLLQGFFTMKSSKVELSIERYSFIICMYN